MKKAYLRESPTFPLAEQMRELERVGFTDWTDFGPAYIDAKPPRADAGWTWRDKIIASCREPDDEVWVAFAGVWAGSAPVALDKLRELTERGATLCVASTGERYRWHPDAAAAMELAHAIEAENKRRITRKATAASVLTAQRVRRAKAKRWAEAKELWLKAPDLTGEEVASRTGFSRALLHRNLGPRGTPRFTRKKKEST